MRIFWPDIHKNLTKNMALTFKKLGHTMLIPSSDWKPTYYPAPPVKKFIWNETWNNDSCSWFGDNVKAVSKEELLETGADVIFITAYENQFEILNEVLPNIKGDFKLAHYSGNDYWLGAYPVDTIYNYLCADYTGFNIAYKHNKNYLYYRPRVDYDFFKYGGTNDSKIFGCYITDYQHTFPDDHEATKSISNSLRDLIKINIHDKSSKDEVYNGMVESAATIHIKRLEGYGYSMIESCAVGRPIFLPLQYSANKSYTNWIIEGKTGFYFSDIRELVKKINLYYISQEVRHKAQENCAKYIREYINNEEQEFELNKFLNNLI